MVDAIRKVIDMARYANIEGCNIDNIICLLDMSSVYRLKAIMQISGLRTMSDETAVVLTKTISKVERTKAKFEIT